MTTDLAWLGGDVEWTDAESASHADRLDQPALGRLRTTMHWMAGTQGRFPVQRPSRARCVVMGGISPGVESLASALGVGVRSVDADAVRGVAAGLTLGAEVADDEVDGGTDLLIVADGDSGTEAGVLVSVLTGAEPVSLLPRGAAATDTELWIAQATALRDARRHIAGLRHEPDELLVALGNPRLAVVAGLLMRAVARRTPVVLDGSSAVVAALLVQQVQARAKRWWTVADTSPDPVHTRALTDLDQTPLLDLRTDRGDGTAGLLTLPLLWAAALASTA